MRRLAIVIVAVALICPLGAEGAWINLGRLGSAEYVHCLARDSRGAIYAGTGGPQGIIYKSVDSGNTWAQNRSFFSDDVYSLLCASDGSLYAGSDHTGVAVVARSTDGVNWTEHSVDGLASTVLCLAEDDNGYIYAGTGNMGGGASGRIYRSTDNGDSWTLNRSFLSDNVYSLLCASDGTLYAGADHTALAVVAVSTDGVSWAEHSINGINATVRSLAEGPDGAIYAGIGGSWSPQARVYRSRDNGSSWEMVNDFLTDNVFSLTSTPGGSIYAGSDHTVTPVVGQSVDQGDSWDEIQVAGIVGDTRGAVFSLLADPYGPVYAGLGRYPVALGAGGRVYKLCRSLRMVSGDYDGDGTSDPAVFRKESGLWAVREVTRTYYGAFPDIPVPGDYDGNGTTEIAIYRGESGLWSMKNLTRVYFGTASDRPIPADYDGDGSDDVGVFRPLSGLWAMRGVSRIYFGGAGDLPLPGDYLAGDGDEIGIYRPTSGLWALRGVSRFYYGTSTDLPLAFNYIGDAVLEAGIFNPASGLWAIRNITRRYFGTSTDLPVPADYDGAFAEDIGIFRETNGLWAVRLFTRVYFGSGGDLPVTR